MFVGFSRRVRGGLRLGAGMRLTKRNFIFMIWVVMVYYMAYLAVVGSVWLMVAIIYGMFIWPIKKIVEVSRRNKFPTEGGIGLTAPAQTNQESRDN